MKKGIIGFLIGLWQVPHHWKIWLLILFLANGFTAFFFLPSLAAVVTVTAFYTGILMAVYLTELYGYGKILSLMHGP